MLGGERINDLHGLDAGGRLKLRRRGAAEGGLHRLGRRADIDVQGLYLVPVTRDVDLGRQAAGRAIDVGRAGSRLQRAENVKLASSTIANYFQADHEIADLPWTR